MTYIVSSGALNSTHSLRVLSLDLKVQRESQFNTAGGSEFQVRGAAVLNDRLANDVRRNGTHSSGTDSRRSQRWLVARYCNALLVGVTIRE